MLIEALAGGMLIGAAAGGLLLVNGHIAGISGILANAGAGGWRLAFIAGLLVAGLGATLLGQAIPASLARTGPVWLAISGLLVGIGTRLGNGCTSGHGVCGIARLSPRSIVATITFMAVAALTVFVTRHLLGTGP